MNTVLDFSMNTGGKMSHLGGAALGYFYFRSLNNGKDFLAGFTQLFDRFLSLFKRSPKLRVVKNEPQNTGSNARSNSTRTRSETQARMDAILDKISKSGYENLSKGEKDFLFKMSNHR
jgi:hypothetical protein